MKYRTYNTAPTAAHEHKQRTGAYQTNTLQEAGHIFHCICVKFYLFIYSFAKRNWDSISTISIPHIYAFNQSPKFNCVCRYICRLCPHHLDFEGVVQFHFQDIYGSKNPLLQITIIDTLNLRLLTINSIGSI